VPSLAYKTHPSRPLPSHTTPLLPEPTKRDTEALPFPICCSARSPAPWSPRR
jgi:hypothetical protein